MKKRGIAVLCWAVVLVLSLAFEVSADEAEEMCVPMGSIELQPPEGVEPQRESVMFPHSGHFGFNCQTCHHQWDGSAPVQSCTTSGCHDSVEPPPDPADTSAAVLYFKNAYHGQCIDCHREMKRQIQNLERSGRTLEEDIPSTGPTSCVGCHPKY
jgi:hypothetical protein